MLFQSKCGLRLGLLLSSFIISVSLDVDYNECDDFSYDCPVNSTCVNSDGSYSCRCDTGYRLDGNGDCAGV